MTLEEQFRTEVFDALDDLLMRVLLAPEDLAKSYGKRSAFIDEFLDKMEQWVRYIG